MEEIAKTYQPESFEKDIYKKWEEQGFFIPTMDESKNSFSIALPPPNVTGSLHMGHAFQQTLMDCLTRYHRMKNDNTLWQCGTDHAGIATQMVVERKLAAEEKLTRHDLGREEFIKRIWQWKEQSGGTITSQMRRLGASVDWSTERFTMDEGLSAAVLEVFVRLYEEDLIYRGKRLVNWDPKLRTAISDLEVENKQVQGSMWYIKYKLADGVKTKEGLDYLVVATTRPETLLGDSAVAINKDDERYNDLIGKELILPLVNRRIKIVADPHADMTTGTGCVKITPAHDFNDYQVGKRNKLNMINIFTQDAKLKDKCDVYDYEGNVLDCEILIPKAYANLDRFEAREIMVKDLQAQDLLVKIEPHTLAQPFGDRGGVPIEPMLTDQWYVRASVLGKDALEAVESGKIKFVPAQYTNMYYSWMRDLQDWCISRQLWWGHRIPAWYDEQNNIYVARNEAEVRTKYKLSDDVKLRQDEDVLDTWFSSALWTFSTLGFPENTKKLKLFHPTSVLVTGFDIIFFWVARMIMMTMHFMKDEQGNSQVPFHTVYVTGLIRDEEGQKMSKSKGNVIDPIDMIDGISIDDLVAKRTSNMMQPQLAQKIEKRTRKQFPNGINAHGTDALRFTLCALASNGRDILWDMSRLEGYRNFCNKIFNASRFVMMNVQDYDLKNFKATSEDLLANSYIKAKLHDTIKEVINSIEHYRFDNLANALYEFIWNEYCDWYLEFTKAIFKDETISYEQKQATAFTLMDVLETVLRLAHPVIPFITEHLWQNCAAMLGRTNKYNSIMMAAYPTEQDFASNAQALEDIGFIKEFISVIRNLRAEMKASPAIALNVMLRGVSTQQELCVKSNQNLITTLANVAQISFVKADEEVAGVISKPILNAEVLVEMKNLINKADELKRLNDMLKKLEANIKGGEAKLANEAFVSKAPANIIQGAKDQLELNKTQLEKVKAAIAQIEAL